MQVPALLSVEAGDSEIGSHVLGRYSSRSQSRCPPRRRLFRDSLGRGSVGWEDQERTAAILGGCEWEGVSKTPNDREIECKVFSWGKEKRILD